MKLIVSNYGATIVSLKVSDKHNEHINVVVGLDNQEEYINKKYLDHKLFLGSSIGRYAGRISGSKLKIEEIQYQIHNEKGVHLHGGKEGFDKQFWNIEKIAKGKNPSITLSYFSKHLEENYPGNLTVRVTYQLLETNSLKITYKATTDRTTVLNLTNHSYFNLNGKGSILDHELFIASDQYLEVDDQLIPTGEVVESINTPFDRTNFSTIKRSDFGGFDDVFILKKKIRKAAVLSSSLTGITMKVFTKQPAIVIYTPSSFPKLNFKDRASYDAYPAICFETQNYPDAPNNIHFPSSILRPNDKYLNETVFDFDVIK